MSSATEAVTDAIRSWGQGSFSIQEIVSASGQKENIVLHVVKTMLEDSTVRYPETAPHNEKRRYTYAPAFRHWEMMTRDWRDISGISDHLSGPGTQAQQRSATEGEDRQEGEGIQGGHRGTHPQVPAGWRPGDQG